MNVLNIVLIQLTEHLFKGGIFQLISGIGPVGKIVLLILLFFSLYSWGITLDKLWKFSKIRKESLNFIRDFKLLKNLRDIYLLSTKSKPSPLVNIFKEGYNFLYQHSNSMNLGNSDKNVVKIETDFESWTESLKTTLSEAVTTEILKMEKKMIFLATTASVTPFIGLFGTVWGIMNAFRSIGTYGTASIATVAPGIAEALINTAAGLFAAIPALIAYNYLSHKIKTHTVLMEQFANQLVNILTSEFKKSVLENINYED